MFGKEAVDLDDVARVGRQLLDEGGQPEHRHDDDEHGKGAAPLARRPAPSGLEPPQATGGSGYAPGAVGAPAQPGAGGQAQYWSDQDEGANNHDGADVGLAQERGANGGADGGGPRVRAGDYMGHEQD